MEAKGLDSKEEPIVDSKTAKNMAIIVHTQQEHKDYIPKRIRTKTKNTKAGMESNINKQKLNDKG